MSTLEKETPFDEHELITSMTDIKGRITYVNNIFCRVSGYNRFELIGEPHNIIRHPDMPRVVFKLLWDTVLSGKSITAFVKNRSKNGDYYWVRAYIAPIIEDNQIVRIVSYRRPVSDFVKTEISKIYKALTAYEKTHSLNESFAFFLSYLNERNLTYEQFIDRLSSGVSVSSSEALKIEVDSYYIDHVIFKSNIIRGIALGKKDVKVSEPCCCNFGKKLKTLEGMPFTSHPSWAKVHYFHNHVHVLMQDYVNVANNGGSQEQMAALITSVEHDTQKLFEMLNDIIDTYVE